MSTVDERDLLDQLQYLASRIYDDPGSELDLFFLPVLAITELAPFMTEKPLGLIEA